jgi:competence protein ComEC
MAVAAGAVFLRVRALLALIPRLTVGFPIKKWSAATALAAAAFYLLLSGAERSFSRSNLHIWTAVRQGLHDRAGLRRDLID